MNVEWSANWDDDLGGSQEHAARDVMLRGIEDKVKLEFEQTFMFYLPRICEHCLNPSCAASCPSRRDLQARGGRHRPRRPGPLPRLAHVRLGLPVQEGLLQPQDRQGREVHVLLPAHRGRHPDRVRGDVRGPAALHRPRALRRRQGARGRDRSRTSTTSTTPSAACFLDPDDPEVRRAAEAAGIPGDWIEAARRSPVWALINDYEVALPLHPEYRTMPMVWYIPPLSPVVDVVTRHRGRRGGPRQPLRGDRHPADPGRVPRQPLHRRRHRARRPGCSRSSPRCAPTCATSTSAATPTTRSPRPWAWRARTMYEMFRLLAIAKYDERYVIPTAHAEQAHALEELATDCPVSDYGGGQQDLFGEGSGYPTPVAVENFRMLQDRQTSDTLGLAGRQGVAGQPAQLGRQGCPGRPLPARGRTTDVPASPARTPGPTPYARCGRPCSVLLDYPTRRAGRVARRRRGPGARPPAASRRSSPTSATRELGALQEEYVATFDHTRKCALYLTYFAYGDTRRRGVALVQFKEAYRAAGVEWDDVDRRAARPPVRGAAVRGDRRRRRRVAAARGPPGGRGDAAARAHRLAQRRRHDRVPVGRGAARPVRHPADPQGRRGRRRTTPGRAGAAGRGGRPRGLRLAWPGPLIASATIPVGAPR